MEREREVSSLAHKTKSHIYVAKSLLFTVINSPTFNEYIVLGLYSFFFFFLLVDESREISAEKALITTSTECMRSKRSRRELFSVSISRGE